MSLQRNCRQLPTSTNNGFTVHESIAFPIHNEPWHCSGDISQALTPALLLQDSVQQNALQQADTCSPFQEKNNPNST